MQSVGIHEHIGPLHQQARQKGERAERGDGGDEKAGGENFFPGGGGEDGHQHGIADQQQGIGQ